MAGHGLLGDAVRVHSLRPPLALVRDAQLRRGHEGQPQTRPAYRSDAEPRLELVQRGLREMGDPARPERTEADGLRQVARLLHARRLAKPHERSARDLVPGRRRAALHQALLGRPRRGALIQVAPHPTLLYNTANGAPGEDGNPGLGLDGGFYRANTSRTNEYWWDGMRRRQSEAAILAGFPNAH